MADSALEILDYPGATGKRQDLREAFMMFNEMSQKLTDSYEFLENRVEQLSGELANVSAQRMQEMAEKERLADKLESLLQLLPAAVLVLDQFGCVRQSNRAADELLLPLAKVESLNGRRWRQLIQTCFKPRRDDGHEISLVDGRRVSLRTAAMTNERGQLILLTDLTETRALQSQLAQHERLSAMGKMVASLAHQIRTPLAAATLYAGHLNSEDLAEEHRIRFAGKLQERLHHLESQVRDMLIFARGEAPLNDDVKVTSLLDGIASAMEVAVAQSGAVCTLENEVGEASLMCNRDSLISAVMNLINNALESCEHPIEIKLVARRDDQGRLCLAVMDNGPGLPDEKKNRMMEPFFTTKSNGTGLGLAVVQAVVRAHHGDFRLTDSPLGGVSAEMYLPLARG